MRQCYPDELTDSFGARTDLRYVAAKLSVNRAGPSRSSFRKSGCMTDEESLSSPSEHRIVPCAEFWRSSTIALPFLSRLEAKQIETNCHATGSKLNRSRPSTV